jgi:hypothetical protein
MWASMGAIGVALLMASLAFSGTVMGPPPDDNPGQPFEQIMDAIEALELDVEGLGDEIDALGDDIDGLSDQLDDLASDIDQLQDDLDDLADDINDIYAEVQNIEDKLDYLELEVFVYEETCGDGSMQCGVSHNYVNAGPTNHNPVRVFVMVTLHGQPVNGLTDADIVFASGFVSAGGPALRECDSTDCGVNYFQSIGNLYGFFVHPYSPYNWKAGEYHARLIVNGPGGVSGITTVEIVVR